MYLYQQVWPSTTLQTTAIKESVHRWLCSPLWWKFKCQNSNKAVWLSCSSVGRRFGNIKIFRFPVYGTCHCSRPEGGFWEEHRWAPKGPVVANIHGWPNVNWSFYSKVETSLRKYLGYALINLGSCGLHLVHNAFQKRVEATDWQVNSLLKALHQLLKDTPARRDDYDEAIINTWTAKSFRTVY